MATAERTEVISDTLSNLDTEPIYSKAKRKIPGGLKFVFTIFYSIACFFFILYVLCPLICGMLVPQAAQNTVTIILSSIFGSIAYFSLIMSLGVNVFKSMATYAALNKLINQDGCDIPALIESELRAEWNESEDHDASIKKKNLKVLISASIRKTNWYFKLIKPLVSWGLFLVFGMNMATVGYFLFYLPIIIALPVAYIKLLPHFSPVIVNLLTDFSAVVTGIQQTIESFANGVMSEILAFITGLPQSLNTLVAFMMSMKFILAVLVLIFILCFILASITFILIWATAFIIWGCTNSIVEKAFRTKWVKKNLPELLEAYKNKVLKKK